MGEWEGTSWSDFIHGDEMTPGSRKLYVDVATRFAAASRGEVTSARTIGKATESTIYLELTGRGESRLFNGPTSEAWIDPWTAHLARLGVRLRLGHDVTRLEVHDGRIAAARVRGPNGSRTIHADWYVLALPVERARALFNRRVMAADTRLLRTANIETGWMTGIQFYLNHPTPIVHGIIACLDSPWAVCGLTQGQFWDRNLPCDYGNGRVRDKLSLAIVDWETPGILYGKPARKCTRAEIAAETWAQLKAHFTYAGAPPLPDSLLVTGDPATSSFLDPGIVFDGHTPRTNQDPLPLNIVGSWEDRPTVDTAIPNLLLASDYVQVDFDIASMEGANEAARRAVNALLDRAGSTQPRAQVYPRLMPGEWQALRQLDDKRYAAGLPNIFDADMAIDQLKTLLAQPLDALARAETGILAAIRP
jgi:uncharacterized protein with NAD-binding domain and iron-sulfur cluster